jgi:hypothetical protein
VPTRAARRCTRAAERFIAHRLASGNPVRPRTLRIGRAAAMLLETVAGLVMEKINLSDVVRLARMDEDGLSALVAQLEYYPADAPTRSPLPRDLMLLDIAINLRAISLKGGPVSAEPQWLELANRPELSETANLVNDISDSSMALGLRVRR